MIIGEQGLMSTPAVSCVIRKRAATGGVILTASHNPGGVHGDMGIKCNMRNGGPAPEGVTDRIHKLTSELKEYLLCDPPLGVALDTKGVQTFSVRDAQKNKAWTLQVEVIDPVCFETKLTSP